MTPNDHHVLTIKQQKPEFRYKLRVTENAYFAEKGKQYYAFYKARLSVLRPSLDGKVETVWEGKKVLENIGKVNMGEAELDHDSPRRGLQKKDFKKSPYRSKTVEADNNNSSSSSSSSSSSAVYTNQGQDVDMISSPAPKNAASSKDVLLTPSKNNDEKDMNGVVIIGTILKHLKKRPSVFDAGVDVNDEDTFGVI